MAYPRRIPRRTGMTGCLAFVLLYGCGGSSSHPSDLPNFPTVQNLNFPTAGPNPSTMNVVQAFSNLAFVNPLFLTHAGDGSDRIFVVERGGRILVFPNQPSVTTMTIYLDIRSRTNAGGEEGLLGLAFDPNYATNGYFYVHYSAASPRRSVLARYTVDGNDADRADPNSEVILLEIGQPYTNHNGGMLAFGPDNMLYASIGDGGSGGDPHNNGQDRGTLLGTVLRIDPHGGSGSMNYGIPADNPFVSTQGARGEVWAYGLRHPWRFSFDRLTGDLWLADVGQGDWEEIDIITKGGNYGWPWFEGSHVFRSGTPPAGLIPPVWDYSHAEGRSITGGYVYRGTLLPSLRGAYLYADFATRKIWALTGSGGAMSNVEIATLSAVSSFGEDQAGEVYVVSLNGSIHKFEARAPSQQPPFPQRLSDTGLFADTQSLMPDPMLLPYELNEPFWSDGAIKRRWLALPENGRISFNSSGTWQFPQGTVLVKHFELPLAVGVPQTTVRLETRVLIHETTGWAGYVYRWNAQQTDADLIGGAETGTYTVHDPMASGGTRQQVWNFPSRNNCVECHTSGYEVLGPRTRQLNRDIRYPNGATHNQIDAWTRIGMFVSPPAPPTLGVYRGSKDLTNTLEDRARTYLAVNCASCHHPGGPTSSNMDLRYDTLLSQTNTVNAAPQNGDLGILNGVLIRPGSKEASVLYERLRLLNQNRMPPIASTLVDDESLALIGQWIDLMQ